MAIYCPQGSGTLRQQLSMMHWLCQSMPEYARVYQSIQEYARVCQSMPEYARVCQSMAEYGRVCKIMPEYARVCQGMPEYACRQILTLFDFTTWFFCCLFLTSSGKMLYAIKLCCKIVMSPKTLQDSSDHSTHYANPPPTGHIRPWDFVQPWY